MAESTNNHKLMTVRCIGGVSPVYIEELIRTIGGSIVTIAPEHAERARELIRGLTLEIVETGQFKCRIYIETKKIEISRKCLEHVWCCSYAYWILYSTYCSGRLIITPTEIDLTADPLVRDAMKLLTWSLRTTFLTGQDLPWPANLPRPTRMPKQLTEDAISNEHTANVLMYSAVAFMLHHELAHYRLRHTDIPDKAEAIGQEREADYEAANWILADCRGEKFDNRALGVSIALSILVAEKIHRGEDIAITHPRSFDRLINTLQRHVHNPHHAAWGMAITIMKVHMDNVGIHIAEKIFDSARAGAEEYANILAERRRDPWT